MSQDTARETASSNNGEPRSASAPQAQVHETQAHEAQVHEAQVHGHGKAPVFGMAWPRSGSSTAISARAPLYALRESLSHSKAHGLTDEAVIGTVSLLLWALVFTVTAKYVLFLMRADNKGEGGTLSLMALAQTAIGQRSIIVFFLGVAGAALFSGDAIITPAISVLSALEGLDLVTKSLDPYVLPITVLILVTLFFVQKSGTARVATFFGPIMLVFFTVIAVLGIMHIGDAPRIFMAFNPILGLSSCSGTGFSDSSCSARCSSP